MGHIVIIGAGTAGIHCAVSLRKYGYEGKITILGDEAERPYQRPPLSKTFLLEGVTPTPLKPDAVYERNNIDLKTGTRVRKIDRKARTVTTSDGRVLPYDTLVLATGSSARRLRCPGANLDGVQHLRSLEDARNLRVALARSRSVVILGGGVIGLEIASGAVRQGKTVTVIEAARRLMSRVTTPIGANMVREKLERDGVDCRLNSRLKSLAGDRGKVTACLLEDGERLPADLVVVGIGSLPNQGLARAAGLTCDNGIPVNENMQTSDVGIYAIGDCANAENPLLGGRFRFETIHNAMAQAQIAASHICGRAPPAPTPPRFWSDLTGMKIKGEGRLSDYDQLVVRKGSNAGETEIRAMHQGQKVAMETVIEQKPPGTALSTAIRSATGPRSWDS